MECVQCKTNNREGRRFCSGCGAPLSVSCPGCGFANDPDERFCGGCGKALNAAAAGARPSGKPDKQAGSEAQRRQLTMMFCDLVGSTALSQRLDPEDMRAVISAYQDSCAGAIARFDGFLAEFIGDGVLAHFGFPKAHEDEAERAVRAGLAVVEAVGKLQSKDGSALAVRVGIATGQVVVGDIVGEGSSQKQAAIGETPNLAARLQALAKPNTVVIANSTHRLVDGLFDCDDLGPQRLKGLSEPVNAYRVRGESGAPSRFEATAERGLTPLVGREEEFAFLLKRWGLATEGESQVVLLAGEAGIGKSRLLRGFRDWLADQPHRRVLYYGSQYHQNSAYYPATNQLERALRFARDDGPQLKLEKLEAMLRESELEVAPHAPLLALLLSLPTENRYPPIDLSPEQIKRKTIDLHAAMMKAMTRASPLLMVVEDLHWVDPSTIELLTALVEQLRASRFLLIGTYRPGFTPPWSSGGHVTFFSLGRLSRKESAAMIARVTSGKSLPEQVLQEIIAKTDGIPLFVEELTKMVLESDMIEEGTDRYLLSGPLLQPAIPASLHDSLMARLERFAPVKELAQLAATLGRTFRHELLAAVSPLESAKLEDALGGLIRAGLLYRHGLPPEVTYEFNHALVRDAAYQSLLKSTRQQYHQRIARVLEERFPEIAEKQPELLAHHCSEAKLTDRAIGYWQRAGQKALGQWANLEAIEHLRKGLELLLTLPETTERSQQELQLQIILAVPLTATSGYATAEVEQAYSRARQLCQQIGNTAQLFPALYGLWRYYLLRAEYSAARELGQQLLGLAESAQDPMLQLASHRALGATLFYLGQLTESRAHLERVSVLESTTLVDPGALIQRTHDVADPQIASLSYASWVMWLLGDADRARALSGDAIALARARAHPFSIALALSFAAWLHQFAREPRAAGERARSALEISTERGFPFWVGWDRIIEGWALDEHAPKEAAVTKIREGLHEWRAQGSELGSAYFLTLLAEAHARMGQTEEGLEALAQAQAFTDRTGERFWYAEQCRLRGELLLQRGAAFEKEAGACFVQSLEVARAQGAKSLELRAAISLGRLRRGEQSDAEARTLLGKIYGEFKAGPQSADSMEAKLLLEQLGA